MSIKPHGGELINLFLSQSEKEIWVEKAHSMTKLKVDTRTLSDIEMLAIGGFSPLRGFVCEKDYKSIVDNMHLSNGIVWPIPITLMVNEEAGNNLKIGQDIALTDDNDDVVAILSLEDKYRADKKYEAIEVFKTDEIAHPAVKYLLTETGPIYLGGSIKVIKRSKPVEFPKYHLDPVQTRQEFEKCGWKTIVAFQTRNPVHRAHEYLQKCAMEIVDGLLLHPIVGYTKEDDIPAPVRMKCYEALLENYYPQGRVLLSVLPAVMRYGGPREAILHSLVRKNYGVTHFIVGRDHAGVGSYYGSYDAQHIFSQFTPEELEIKPLFFENSFYCNKCGNMATSKTCSHEDKDHVVLSGTKVRQMLKEGLLPPVEFTRPEVAKILIEWAQKNNKKEAKSCCCCSQPSN